MKKLSSGLMLCATVILLSGCESPRYVWNEYHTHLYDYYANTLDEKAYMQVLLDAVDQAAAGQKKVAPGLYAELGTAYRRQGDLMQARRCYAKERECWPESARLMTALIAAVDRAASRAKTGGVQ